jgi:sugar phosphate isomerase/epimerase
MKICFGAAMSGRPSHGHWTPSGHVGSVGPSAEYRRNLYRWLSKHGFDGVEVNFSWWNPYHATTEELVSLRNEMKEYGLELAGFNALRHNLSVPVCAASNKADLLHMVEISKPVAPVVIDVSLSLPETEVRGMPTSGIAAGKIATEEDYEKSAEVLVEIARKAQPAGIEIAVELHHCGITDTSTRLLKLVKMINEPNVSANPDLGNLMWGYAEPEEPWYEAIKNLAGHVKLWHVKNVQLVQVPEIQRSYWVHAGLGEGDIDYRWALGKLMEEGFDGWISIESSGPGDLLAFVGRGIDYLRELLEEQKQGIGMLVQ